MESLQMLSIDENSQQSARKEEATYILHTNHTSRYPLNIPNVTTLPELFRWQAHRRGDATLFSFRTSPDESLTFVSYSEAYETSSHLANTLHCLCKTQQASQNSTIAIWLEKSIDLHLAILATAISGAAWLPFDADVPAARVTACLLDSNACILLCDAAHHSSAVEATKDVPGCRVMTLQELRSETQSPPETQNDIVGPSPESTAYMIYTSGSSGTPKGIEISHRAALTFCLSERSVLETDVNDVVWQGFSAAFDMFIEEVWVSIAGGAHIAIGSRAECQDYQNLGAVGGTWAQREVTIVNAVPTLINIMTSLGECRLPESVRLLNLGGEACPPALVTRLWHPRLRIFNTYGPSETTVTATFQELFPDQPVTIGKPLPIYHAILLPILDASPKTWTPISLKEGAEGELAIGGPCLGKGYVKRPELTAEKFITHPLPLTRDERLYRTGDHVRLDKDLNIVFLGRIDTQVKHRGFRIELGEIEQSITGHSRVQTAAVILSSTTDLLEAYVVIKDGTAIAIKEIRDQLRRLPAYMQPEAFHFISADDVPRLPSGKINVKALQQTSADLAAAAQKQKADRIDNQRPSISTTTTLIDDGSDLSILLTTMLEIFPQAKHITATSDFFDDLGGHSLLAAILVSKLRKESPDSSALKQLGLQSIYIHRNAQSIAASLENVSVNEKAAYEQKLESRQEDHWPVSRTRHVLCGFAQAVALLLFYFIEAVSILAPYLGFYGGLRTLGLGFACLIAYAIFVVLPPLRDIIGIVGKWLVLGKAKPGEYPLYGVYYFRWWLADRFIHLVDMVSIANTPVLSVIMRCLGAKVGGHCQIDVHYVGAAFDLLTISDDVVVGRDTVLTTSWVERGRLVLAPVTVGVGAHIGSSSVIEGDSTIEEGGELGPLSMLPQGSRIPAGERWVGSPARFKCLSPNPGSERATRPSFVRMLLMMLGMAFSSIFILPVMYFTPQIPSLLLFEYINFPGIGWVAQTAIVAVPAGIIYMILVFVELVVFRWIVLGKVVECSYRTTSIYFYRKWFVDRIMDMSLVIFHPVYATLYVVPFLRSLGVKVGRGAEVSTARGVNFQLTEIGDESFVADNVLIGDSEMRNHTVTLKKTKLNKRAFLGNGSLVPQGTEMASNTLVGVLSCAPEVALKEGESCFGSPAVIMPVRQRSTINHSDRVLYKPGAQLIATRLFIEGLRIVVPRIMITFGLGFGLQIFEIAFPYIGIWPLILLLPAFYFFFFALPALFTTVLFKWLLIGRYTRAEWPLWSLNVWLSEFTTSYYETMLRPLLMDSLTGTPFLAIIYRMLGVQIGSLTTLLSEDITEFDMVSIGDEAVINRHAGPQTHLFEDRIMKVGRVDVERRACMKSYSVALPGSRIAEGGSLGCLSLVMKGEVVPAHEAWEGAPIGPRRRA